MNDRLLPPPPTKPEHAAEVWAELIDIGEKLIRAGIQSRHPPDKVDELYREWRRRERDDHDRRLEHLLAELSRRESAGAG